MVVSFEEFGSNDVKLYREYLCSARVQARCLDGIRGLRGSAGGECRAVDAEVVGCGEGDGAVVAFESIGVNAGGDRFCCGDSGICDTCASRFGASAFGVGREGEHVGRNGDWSAGRCKRVVDSVEFVGGRRGVVSDASGVAREFDMSGVTDEIVARVEAAFTKVIHQQLGIAASGGAHCDELVVQLAEPKSEESDGTGAKGKEELCVGERTLANRRKRAKKRERKLRRQGGDEVDSVPEWRRKDLVKEQYRGAFSSCSEDVRKRLADTRALRLIAENEFYARKAKTQSETWGTSEKNWSKREKLRALEVDQRIELTRCRDLDKIKKRNETRLMRDTEVNKVAVERAYGTLSASGNIPGVVDASGVPFVGGRASTIKSGSISPNSSASEAEVRKLQKDFLDVKKSNDDLVRRLRALQICMEGKDMEGAAKIFREDCQAMYEESAGITVDEFGVPICLHEDSYEGYIDSRGRFHFGQDINAFIDSF